MPLVDIADPHCPLPDILLFDTNILLALSPSLPSSPHQSVVKQFLNRVSTEALTGRVLCVAPVLTFEECYFKLIQLRYLADLPAHEARLKSTLGRKRVTWNDLYKDQPGLIVGYMPQVTSFRAAVMNLPIVPIEPEDLGSPPPALEPRMLHHIGNVPILPKDAYLLAVAERLNVPHIATLDKDFRGPSWLTVYTII